MNTSICWSKAREPIVEQGEMVASLSLTLVGLCWVGEPNFHSDVDILFCTTVQVIPDLQIVNIKPVPPRITTSLTNWQSESSSPPLAHAPMDGCLIWIAN